MIKGMSKVIGCDCICVRVIVWMGWKIWGMYGMNVCSSNTNMTLLSFNSHMIIPY